MRTWTTAAAIAIAAAVLEGAWYLGNPISFTNVAVQPKRQVFRLLADSNVDWAQNRDKIEDWIAPHGIPPSRIDPVHVLAGANVIGLNALTGAGPFDFERYRWLREHADPVAHFGHTYLLFEVDDALYDRFLDENRALSPSAAAARLCPDPGERLDAGEKQRFAFDGVVEAARAWLVCVSAPRGTDLALRGLRGGVRVGALVDGAEPPTIETLMGEQIVWYRLAPGTHAFLVRPIPNRRAWLPSTFEGEWQARRRGAHLAIREVRTEALAAN
jgi:hypothetical protein